MARDERYPAVRADYEAGLGVGELCAKYNLSRNTINSWRDRDRRRGDPWKEPVRKQKRGSRTSGRRKKPGKVYDIRVEKFKRLAAVMPSKTQAAKAAGFPERSAHNAAWRLMKRDDVREAVHANQAALMDSLGLDPASLLRIQKELLERCMAGLEVLNQDGVPVEVPVKVPAEGGGEIELRARLWRFDAKGANTALAKLFELRGMTMVGKEGAGAERPDAEVPVEDLIG